MKRKLLGSMLTGAVLFSGCLPGDIRPEPGRVYVTAEASAATTEGFSTDDNWTIRFERLLVGIGNVSLEGQDCNEYSGSGYDRLFEFTLSGAQKLGEAYGLGACDIEFRLRSPSDESLLQKGVSAGDHEFMRELTLEGVEIPENLPFNGRLPRTGVYARGTATRGGVVKRFDWKFIVGRYELSNCENAVDGSKTSLVNLKAAEDLRLAVTFHGEDLFRDGIAPGDLHRFDRLAAADADMDGNITLVELSAVPAPEVEGEVPIDDDDDLIPRLPGWAGFMTEQLLPRMAYLDGSRCRLRPDEPRMGGGPF